MPVSNYPNGFKNGLVLRGVPTEIPHPGKVFWVNNSTVLPDQGIGGSDGHAGTYLQPYSTIDFAIGRCKADRGDVIYVMPGHVEDITAAESIDLDVAGVSIIGLGRGDKQCRFDFTNTAGIVKVDEDNISIVNMNFHANVPNVVIGLSVTTLATNLLVAGCYFDTETIGTDEFDISINVGVDCNRMVVENTKIDMDVAGSAAVGIKYVGSGTDYVIRDCEIVGDYSLANIDNITTKLERVLIEDNLLMNGASDNIGTVACIILLTGSDGTIRNNDLITNLATPDLSVVADTVMMLGNRYSETITGAEELLYTPKVPDDANNLIGVNDSNNAAVTSSVVSNRDGSILERLEDIEFQMARLNFKGAAVMVNGDTIFTVAGGPILIESLLSECATANDGTASTVQYQVDPTTGAAVTISGASASLACAVAGATLTLQGTALTTAALLNASGGNVGMSANGLMVTEGVIKIVVAVGSTTGTWTHHLRWRPLQAGVTVS